MGFSEVNTKTTIKFDFLDNFFNKEKKEFIRVWTKKIQEAFYILIHKLKLTSKWVDENIVKPILLKLTELWQCSYAMIQTSTISRHEYFELQEEFNKEAENLLKRFEEKLEEKQRQQHQPRQDSNDCQGESTPDHYYQQDQENYNRQEPQQQSNKKLD
ncbi:hypothetical protein ACTFIV_010632 [Dictyostelium citrinum]